jgi:transcriptional regulator
MYVNPLHRLTNVHEARRATPWRVGDAPSSFIDKFLRAIVGIEMPIDRLEGKLKASQDEALPDRLGTVRGLQQETADEAGLMAALVMKAIDADTPGRP